MAGDTVSPANLPTALLAVPANRTVARIDFPFTRLPVIWARFTEVNLFIGHRQCALTLERSSKVKKKLDEISEFVFTKLALAK